MRPTRCTTSGSPPRSRATSRAPWRSSTRRKWSGQPSSGPSCGSAGSTRISPSGWCPRRRTTPATRWLWLPDRGWDGLEAEAGYSSRSASCCRRGPDGAAGQADRARTCSRARTERGTGSPSTSCSSPFREATAAKDLAPHRGGRTTARHRPRRGGRRPAGHGRTRVPSPRRPIRAKVLLGPLTGLERPGRSTYGPGRGSRAHCCPRPTATTAADASLRRAWAVVEAQRSLLGATELRAASATHASPSSSRPASPCGRRDRRVFDWAERGRAAALRRSAVAPRRPRARHGAGAAALGGSGRGGELLDGEGDPVAAPAGTQRGRRTPVTGATRGDEDTAPATVGSIRRRSTASVRRLLRARRPDVGGGHAAAGEHDS